MSPDPLRAGEIMLQNRSGLRDSLADLTIMGGWSTQVALLRLLIQCVVVFQHVTQPYMPLTSVVPRPWTLTSQLALLQLLAGGNLKGVAFT